MTRLGVFLLFLVIPFVALAQGFTPDPDWRFENFNSQNHFISREINAIAMDKNGYVWTASWGVQRFDGYRTLDFNSFDQSKDRLRDNGTDLTADSLGRIWISSSGLCYYDDASGKFIYVDSGPGRRINYVVGAYALGNYLWFACNYGLVKLDLKTLKVFYTALNHISNPLCIHQVSNNSLLVTSRDKIYLYNIKENTYASDVFVYNHAIVKVFTAIKRGDHVFLGTTAGLFRFGSLKDISLVTPATKDVIVDALLFMPADSDKRYLFVGTEGKGIMIYDVLKGEVVLRYLHDENNLYSLPDNIILAFFADRKGRLWIGTSSGMSMLDAANQQWKMRFLNKMSNDELSITNIARDKFDSTKVWMSSFNQGMIRIDWRTKKIEKIFKAGPATNRLYAFMQVSKDKWLLATPKLIIEWEPDRGVLAKKELPVPDSLKLVYSIRKIIYADANTCFITTNLGLFRYDLQKHEVSAVSTNFAQKTDVDVLKYDLQSGLYDNGELWVASRNGLLTYNVTTNTTTFFTGQGPRLNYFFSDLTEVQGGWLACSSAHGIAIFNKRRQTFDIINRIAGFYNPSSPNITHTGNTIWIGTEAGILTYDMHTGQSSRVEQESPQLQILYSSPLTRVGDNIVVGFRNRYAYFTPRLKNVPVPSSPVIEGVYVNNQPFLHNYTTGASNGKYTFNHSDNSIDISFTAFLYSDPNHINFRYRLKGAGSGWQYTQDQRSANYAQLAPGKYTFYVQSGTKNSYWNSRAASFSFVILPPYWETWWFRIAVVAVIGFGLYRLYRYRVKNILAIERIRERIASDFHDDIGSALSSISIFSEVADKQLREQQPIEKTREVIGHISHHSRTMLEAMDDIIWAVNPQNDHLSDLAVRMREFAIPLLEAKNIQFEIDIDEGLANTRIRMEARKNIFLIFKECINNILKHSGCMAMKVTVNKLNNQLELIISDNGKGYDINASNTRNGLKNMRKRAAEINGTIHFTTQKGEGTLTRLLVNII